MSSKKNKSGSIWYVCDVCKAVLVHKDISNHRESSCPPSVQQWTHPFVNDNRLYTTADIFHLQDSSLKFLSNDDINDVVLINCQALQLSNIPIGNPVVVSPTNGAPFVKIAWPSEEKGPVSLKVALTKEAAALNGIESGSCVILSECRSRIYPASEICIECKSTGLTDKELSDLIPKIQKQYLDKIFCVGNKLLFRYYGKNLYFEITNLTGLSKDDSIDENLEKLDLNDKFYLLVSDTKWKIDGLVMKDVKSDSLLSRIGGLNEVIMEIDETIAMVLNNEAIIPGLHISRGVLVFGPSGTGKTMVIEALAQKWTSNVIRIEGCEVFSKFLGESEKKLKYFFDKAIENSPSIILIDEIDNLCPKGTSRTEQEKRILTTLSTLMDNLHAKSKPVMVLATTSKINSIDKSLRRPGRFGKEVEIQVPNPDNRYDILKILLSDLKHDLSDDEMREISSAAHGYVGADLALLVSKAVLRNFNEKAVKSKLCSADLIWALGKIKPSAMKEILIEVPNVKWCDVGGQHDLKLKLKQAVEWPLKHGESFKRLGICPPRGVLMFGPPGCSKTMIAKALATESQLNFISVKGPELFSKWVGESEKAVREVFRRARQAAPSIVFFDELDALGGERSSHSGGTNVQERVLAQLLTELDGVEPLNNVTVVGATNRPDRIDPALLRPGRLDRIIYVPLPDSATRSEIFSIQLKRTPIGKDVIISELVDKTEGYSGAEIVAVCHEAALKALEENIEAKFVERNHFLSALSIVLPRTSRNLLKIYEDYVNNKMF